MVSSAAHAFLSLAGWSVVPDIATRQALGIIHRLSFPVFNKRPPQPSTPTYRKHYRYTFATVVLGYLLYNLMQGARSMDPNFYQILGVRPSVDENGLKLAFRQFARKYHPDRPGVGPDGEAIFIAVRDAFEALKNPTVRFAYDRFGPDVLTWTQCTTTKEFLQRGLIQCSGYHIVACACLLFWSTVSPSPVSFWRYMLYFTLLASELALILSPSSTPLDPSPSADPSAGPAHRTILDIAFPQRVAYQHILFLHQLFLFLSIALSRVAPQIFVEEPMAVGIPEKIAALAAIADREASIMLHAELHSIHPLSSDEICVNIARKPYDNPSKEVLDLLSEEMENMIIEANIIQEVGPLKSACEAAVTQGRRSRASTSGDPLANGDGGSGTLPSPISPCGTPPRELASHDDWQSSPGRLPSPRPSPPPPPTLHRRTSSYVRARSVSY